MTDLSPLTDRREEAKPIAGAIAEEHLRGRGIACPLAGILRFHPACWHQSGKRLLALVAMVEGAERFAVHRTHPRANGTWKEAIDPNRAMLGAVAGGAARLTGAQGPFLAAEGLETALALNCGLLGFPATIWAALSGSGMRALYLPPEPGRLIVATNCDHAGRTAGHDLAFRADALGWQVSLFPAPEGHDSHDVLRGKAVAA